MEFLIGKIITYNSIATITSKTYSTVCYLFTVNHSDLNDCLKELDLQFKLSIIDSIINQERKKCIEQSQMIDPQFNVNNINQTNVINNNNKFKSCIDISIDYLISSTENIRDELKIIEDRIKRHNNKWFHNYRNLNLEKNFEKLREYSKILDTRYKYFVKLKEAHF